MVCAGVCVCAHMHVSVHEHALSCPSAEACVWALMLLHMCFSPNLLPLLLPVHTTALHMHQSHL